MAIAVTLHGLTILDVWWTPIFLFLPIFLRFVKKWKISMSRSVNFLQNAPSNSVQLTSSFSHYALSLKRRRWPPIVITSKSLSLHSRSLKKIYQVENFHVNILNNIQWSKFYFSQLVISLLMEDSFWKWQFAQWHWMHLIKSSKRLSLVEVLGGSLPKQFWVNYTRLTFWFVVLLCDSSCPSRQVVPCRG